MASKTTNPAPSSPILPLQQAWLSLPLENYYLPITHKEKLAIKTMESIPEILQDASLLEMEHPISPTMYFSPSQLPLQDRMAVIFSRVLAHARLEADNGGWTFEAANEEVMNATTGPMPDQVTGVKKGFQAEDLMSSSEAEEFLANIETIHVEVDGETKWIRRYHRVTKPGEQHKEGAGAVRAAVGKTLPAFVMPSIGQKMKKHKNDERAPIADIEVGIDGVAVGGWWNSSFHHHQVAAARGHPSRRVAPNNSS